MSLIKKKKIKKSMNKIKWKQLFLEAEKGLYKQKKEWLLGFPVVTVSF
jgi:hypothetical protein